MYDVSICAIISVRNELYYLKFLLPRLAAQGIDVYILDNESTDGVSGLYAKYMGAPIIEVETLPYHGFFSLTDQLEAKRRVVDGLCHDWVVHHDADEILEHHAPGRNLRDAIEEADRSGCTALNFNEFVFLPEVGEDLRGEDYYTKAGRYYYFAPKPKRLNRAWKREAGLSNMNGGHHLAGANLKLAQVDHALRHYIVLSEEHARAKYLGRTFDPQDRKRKWHGNRLRFTHENLALPGEHPCLLRVDPKHPQELDVRRPTSKHYWEW